MAERSVADGRLEIPASWPKWKLRCQAHGRHSKKPCGNWAVMGMPTCKHHGSGGEKNRQLGQLRYLAWIITGGCQERPMPVEPWVRLSMAVICEMVFNQGVGTIDQQMKAALWLTEVLG